MRRRLEEPAGRIREDARGGVQSFIRASLAPPASLPIDERPSEEHRPARRRRLSGESRLTEAVKSGSIDPKWSYPTPFRALVSAGFESGFTRHCPVRLNCRLKGGFPADLRSTVTLVCRAGKSRRILVGGPIRSVQAPAPSTSAHGIPPLASPSSLSLSSGRGNRRSSQAVDPAQDRGDHRARHCHLGRSYQYQNQRGASAGDRRIGESGTESPKLWTHSHRCTTRVGVSCSPPSRNATLERLTHHSTMPATPCSIEVASNSRRSTSPSNRPISCPRIPYNRASVGCRPRVAGSVRSGFPVPCTRAGCSAPDGRRAPARCARDARCRAP